LENKKTLAITQGFEHVKGYAGSDAGKRGICSEHVSGRWIFYQGRKSAKWVAFLLRQDCPRMMMANILVQKLQFRPGRLEQEKCDAMGPSGVES